jgi:hypothetical protein
MPFCPSCQIEYRPGFTRCTDCDVELVPSLPQEAPAEGDTAPMELVELATFPNASEAEMIQELLEDNGISTVLRGDADPLGVIAGSTIITLLVKQADLPEAQKLYDGYFAGEVEGQPQPELDDEEEDSDQPSLPDPRERS